MSRAQQIRRLVLVVGTEAGALAWLLGPGRRSWLRISWSDFGTWIRVTPTEDAIVAFIWLAALGCALWMAGSTLLYLVARASGVPALIRSVEWMTLPPIRRVTERALGALLVASTMAAAPVRADPPPPIVVIVDRQGALLPPGLAGGPSNTTQDLVGTPQSTVPPLPTIPDQNRAAQDEIATTEMTVRSGDNLWVMCRRYLTNELGRRPTNEEIAPYWLKVMTLNEPALISGNPDLIYSGEIIAMPTPL